MQRHTSQGFLQGLLQESCPQQSLQRHLRRLTHLLFLLFLFSLTSSDNGVSAQSREERTYPLLASIPKTTFRCRGHSAGYYADPETGCQVYHMCDTLEKQYSYLCPNHTLFNQKFMVCDHWYMVNCSSATTFYELNDHIGEVPNSSERDDSQTNAIQDSGNDRSSLSNRDTTSKEVKTSVPVATTLKTQGSTPAKPQVPSNSRTTPITTPKPSSTTRQFTTQSISPSRSTASFFSPTPSVSSSSSTPARGQSLPRQFTKQTVTPSITTASFFTPTPTVPSFSPSPARGQNLKPAVKSVEEPSLFFDLPDVESIFTKISSSVKPAPPPSVFFDTPDKEFDGSSEQPNRKHGIPANESPVNDKLINEVDIPFAQTPSPVSPFTMVPGVVARNPGGKFSFTGGGGSKPSFLPLAFQDVLFRPVVIRPKDKLRKIFTSAPASITSRPPFPDDRVSDQAIQHSRPTVFAAPLRNNNISSVRGSGPSFSSRNGVEIPSIDLQPPPPPLLPVSLNIPPFLPLLQQTLTPPGEGKQEFILTPVRFRNANLQQPLPGSSVAFNGFSRFTFPASRSNREFFIPSPGLSLPDKELPAVTKNGLDDTEQDHSHDDHSHSNMTMVFPTPHNNTRVTALQINPKCPKCHPAFLRAGECTPCVLIR